MMETGKSLSELSIFPLTGKETNLTELIGLDIFFEEYRCGKEGSYVHHIVLDIYSIKFAEPCFTSSETLIRRTLIRTVDICTKQECFVLVPTLGYFQVMLVSKSGPYFQEDGNGGMIAKNLWSYNVPIEKSGLLMYYIAKESLA